MIRNMATETVTKKLFTVDEYHRLWDVGLLPEDGRFELIRGEIFEMPTPQSPHSGRVNRLNMLFASRLAGSVIVSVQNPFFVDEMSEPQPDVLLLKPRADFYVKSHPTPEDVLLAVEVSHTTGYHDTKVKGPLYAEALVREYWILDVQKNVLEVRTKPAEGKYSSIEVFRHGQSIRLQQLPSASFTIEEILG
jgi:Uma2 family endonuclease